MNILLDPLINIIFYAEIIFLIISVASIQSRYSRSLLVHSITVIIIVLPHYLNINHWPMSASLYRLTDAGLILFPLSAAYVQFYQFLQPPGKSIIVLYVLAGISFFGYLAFPSHSVLNIFILHILSWCFMLFLFRGRRRGIPGLSYNIAISCNIAALALMAAFKRDIESLLFSSGGLSIVFFIIIITDYLNRVIEMSKRLEKTHEANKKLTHTVSRLKISNEQIRKIITQKDLELLQLSRHASLAEITTGIAHELSQPLTGIKGIAQNMIDDINYDEFDNLQAVSELQKISSLVDKSSSIIDHIRNFSKKSMFTMKSMDINKVVLDAIGLIKNQLKKNDIDLIFILDENIPQILGNNVSLEQMIVNFILNARDAIVEKKQSAPGLEGQIHVTTFIDEHSVTLTIKDNGTGIPDDIIQKIWSPFFTTKSRGQGTGIGLSICSRIIREHHAILDVKTSRDGTVFTIKFPVKE
ncbi:MAG TPA: ATP-binding protein [Spirochaetota bacterium]|nr:ATP-binding protein [Spirochaetota bacterium]HRZ26010.1 ATP-binding protein [Spirochaetota bacterium]HSA16257.1 ATP-binding protein [Spirochaetota bacterium]